MAQVIDLNFEPSEIAPADYLVIAEVFARERDLNALLRHFLDIAMAQTEADGGVIFRLHDDKELKFVNARTDSLKRDLYEESGDNSLPGIPLYDKSTGLPNHHHVAVHAAISGEAIEIEDIYKTTGYDFSGTRKFDSVNVYRTSSVRLEPIKDSDGNVVAVLQLSNPVSLEPKFKIGFDEPKRQILRQLLSLVEINVQNRVLELDQRKFIESVIQVLAQAIDAKSPHTGNHCQKVPIINELLAKAACAQIAGPFADFDLNEDEMYELKAAAWLHDCGKIAVPDHIMSKASRLESVRDGVHEIATRIELVKRDLRLAAQQRLLQNPDKENEIDADLDDKLTAMNRNLAYIMTINYAEIINDPEIEYRIRNIAAIRWTDWNGFDQPLLNINEIEALLVRSGTLTQSEREIIERHASHGIEMLSRLEFPKNLRNVPLIAGAHHERVDGTGYPNQLKGDQMPLAARMLAIADIFEALTASDRPYKRQKSLNQAIAIMSNMRDAGHIDAEVFELFLDSKIWLEYATRFMPMQAIDQVLVANYRRRATAVTIDDGRRLAAE